MSKKSGGSKFDISRIIDAIRQAIPNQVSTPKPVGGDILGQSLKKLSEQAKSSAKQHADMTQQLYDLEHGINKLFASIEQVRKQIEEAKLAVQQADSSSEEGDKPLAEKASEGVAAADSVDQSTAVSQENKNAD